MSNEEARRILMSDADFSGTGEKAKPTADALCVAVDALEKAEKYRWHDLSENPDDLPSDDVQWYEMAVLRKGRYKNHIEYNSVDRFLYGDFIDETGRPVNRNDVIAWREIEPFKEVQE